MTPTEQIAFDYDWRGIWARPEQVAPEGLWEVWLAMAGRGWGKTRTGGEFVREEIEAGRATRVALVAPTVGDYRKVMVEGESGLIAISRPDFMPEWEPSNYTLYWPNGAVCICYSAEKPDRLRGPQHDLFWCDELAAWKYAQETWDNLMFGLRLGNNPRGVITTTPRPVRTLRSILKDPGTVITGGSTYENMANLAPKFIATVIRKYEGTSLGRQELHAQLLTEMPGALWTRKTLEEGRRDATETPGMLRIIIAVDPAVTSGEEADETGIIVAGLGTDFHAYVLWDESGRYSPNEWGHVIARLYKRYQADAVVAEVNNGGEMVEYVIATVDARIPVISVHASRGKRSRAEPVSALYEQGRCHHLRLPMKANELGDLEPVFEELEDQLCTWTSDSEESPDRLDALVWAITDLMLRDDEELVEDDEDYVISPT